MIFEIFWEKDSKGTSAIIKLCVLNKMIMGTSKKIAWLKMTTIFIISGHFQPHYLYFYPLLWVLFETPKKLEFFGVYKRQISENESEYTNHPFICLRKCVWSGEQDLKAMKAAMSSETYIKNYLYSESSINSTNFFINSSDSQEILFLVSEFLNHVKQGVKLEESNLVNPEFEEIRYYINDDFIEYNLNYSLYTNRVTVLEEWTKKWRNCFEESKTKKKYFSDEKYQVSYSHSFLDYFNDFLDEFGEEPPDEAQNLVEQSEEEK